MKKTFTTIIILLLIQGCGYAPMYSKNQKTDFYIQSINFNDGDRDLTNFIKINLNNYFDKKAGKNFVINATINYKKSALSKSAEGVVEQYDLTSTASFQVNFENINKTINISEISNMNNFSDEFKEREIEQTIKKNMARSIVSKLLLQLTRFNAS